MNRITITDFEDRTWSLSFLIDGRVIRIDLGKPKTVVNERDRFTDRTFAVTDMTARLLADVCEMAAPTMSEDA